MIEKVRQLIQCDRRMTIVELEQEVGISHRSIHMILSDDLRPDVSVLYRTEPHRLLCSSSCQCPTTLLSGFHSEWLLAVPYSENGPQGGAFRNDSGHQMECDGRTPEDSKRSLPPVLPTVRACVRACVCVRTQGSYFEGDLVSVVICPTITVLYHISRNFLTAPRIYVFCVDLRTNSDYFPIQH
jgi:hypothetical protein